MNRTQTLAVAGVALALLALAPSAQAIRVGVPPEVQGPLRSLPNVYLPIPAVPGAPPCVDPTNGVVIIALDCIDYVGGPVAGWLTEDMVAWALEYEGRAVAYKDAARAYADDLTAYAGVLAGAIVDYATATAAPYTAFAGEAADAATDYEAALTAAATSYAGALASYATAYTTAVLAWEAGATTTLTGDALADEAWAICHVVGSGCQVQPPIPQSPGTPPVPDSGGVPQPPVVLPNVPATPGLPGTPVVPQAPLPPPVPQPQQVPPPPH